MNTLDPIVWSILLMGIGCALIVLEVFLPSGGFLSILAAAAFFGAIGVAWYYKGAWTGVSLMLVTVIIVPIIAALAFRYWPSTPMGRAFLGELPDEAAVSPGDPRRALIGRVGVARSKMLPAGAVLIDGRLYDAVSQGMAIDPEQYVVVTEVRGNRVVVRPANDDERPERPRGDSLLDRPIEELGIESLDDPLA
jgi:membrane-bound serine protease (ClpP class)